jgi:hypothetical protein
MKSKCEICGSEGSKNNKIFIIRIGNENPEGKIAYTKRKFCEICISYGAEMYESYMKIKMAPSSCKRRR